MRQHGRFARGVSTLIGPALAVLAMAGLFGGASPARAQDAVFVQTAGSGQQYVFTTVSAGEGAILGAEGDLPPVFPAGRLRVDIGFDYLRPDWSNRAVRLALPPAARDNFPVFTDSGNLSEEFAFVPRFGVEYEFGDLGFGVGASGKLIKVSGELFRELTVAGASATLDARGHVDIATANLLEAIRIIDLADHEGLCETCFGDCRLVFTAGTRYAYTQQRFHAELRSDGNTAILDVDQEFTGFGLTSSASTLCPLGESDFFLYGSARGSVLVGRNNRNASFAVNIPATPADATSTIVKEKRTDLIPVGEFELGVAWGRVLRQEQRALGAGTVTGPLLWLKAGFLFQIWGDLGLLSATDQPQYFSQENLYLYGFSVMGGIER